MILDVLLLPFVLLIGAVTSYEDLRYGKVRNKWIVWGAVWGLLVLIVFTLWYPIASPITRFYYFNILKLPSGSLAPVFTINITYLLRSFLNAFLALLIGFLMWRLGAWAAGDAKLFFVYSLLIPLTYYWKSFFHYFPSFALLINIFIPVFLYLLFRALFYYIRFLYLKITQKQLTIARHKKKEWLKKVKEMGEGISRTMFILLTVFLAFGLLRAPVYKYISFDISPLLMFIIAAFIIFAGSASKLFKKAFFLKVIVGVFAVLLIYGLISSFELTLFILWQSIRRMIFFVAVFASTRFLIDFYIAQTGRRIVKIGRLEAGANLDEETARTLKEDEEYFKRHIGTIYPEGLTEEQVRAVQTWFERNKKAGQRVAVYQPFPFVAWIFLGVIITLIFKGSIFHLLLKWYMY